jgi:hypothetical protein
MPVEEPVMNKRDIGFGHFFKIPAAVASRRAGFET